MWSNYALIVLWVALGLTLIEVEIRSYRGYVQRRRLNALLQRELALTAGRERHLHETPSQN